MRLASLLGLLAAVCMIVICMSTFSADASTSSSSGSSGGAKTATQTRQSGISTVVSVVSALGSLVPQMLTNVAPLLLLFGLGALMMPTTFGSMGLMRDSRRSSNSINDQQPHVYPSANLPLAFAQYAKPLQTSPQDVYYFTKRSLPSFASQFNSAGLWSGLQDFAERVVRAIDNADKNYASN